MLTIYKFKAINKYILMKQLFTLLATVFVTVTTVAQIGIGTTAPNATEVLEACSTSQGFLRPRITAA